LSTTCWYVATVAFAPFLAIATIIATFTIIVVVTIVTIVTSLSRCYSLYLICRITTTFSQSNAPVAHTENADKKQKWFLMHNLLVGGNVQMGTVLSSTLFF
jgi:hypothetical protein